MNANLSPAHICHRPSVTCTGDCKVNVQQWKIFFHYCLTVIMTQLLGIKFSKQYQELVAMKEEEYEGYKTDTSEWLLNENHDEIFFKY